MHQIERITTLENTVVEENVVREQRDDHSTSYI